MTTTATYNVRSTVDAGEWSELFAQTAQHSHLFQSWAFGEAKRAEGIRPHRLIIERSGEAVALCQVFEKRLIGTPFRVASRINRGPLLLRQDEPDVGGIYQTLRRRWRYLIRGVLLLAPAVTDTSENQRLIEGAGFRKNMLRTESGWRSSYMDLSLPSGQLRKNLSAKWRGHLNASERRGLTLRTSNAPEDIAWIIDRHIENMQQKNFEGPTPAFVQSLQHTARDDLFVLQACLDGDPVGGALIARFGHTAEYYISWYGPEGRKTNAGNFIVWNAALEMQRRGCRFFDLGGFSSDFSGHGVFKKAINGIEYRLAGEWLAF